MYPFKIMCFNWIGCKHLMFMKFFYDNSFVFGSIGFDPRFLAFVAVI